MEGGDAQNIVALRAYKYIKQIKDVSQRSK